MVQLVDMESDLEVRDEKNEPDQEYGTYVKIRNVLPVKLFKLQLIMVCGKQSERRKIDRL